ncbi:dynamin family protein [Aspergillus lucknowensis]|uniref:P-loop containing nucleoside triphosphate hydrolase protein n=1 Tax=Aspergillus lucknowensis TaxID=176173 RepID=A0ABR4LE72_9EURO
MARARLSDPTVLAKIHQLISFNAGDYIDLPQLVVVGERSSGKSSVLKGLTKLPFPCDTRLGTRFATQVTFRRTKDGCDRGATAKIIPAPQTDPDLEADLKAGKRTIMGEITPQGFSELMRTAHTLMLARTAEDKARPAFSPHRFHLEIYGPDEDHLSVIDLPGIFTDRGPEETTEDDRDMVHNMVTDHLKEHASIILTVFPAKSDVAAQDIAQIVRRLDSDGQRTLGVLTKPDLVDPGAEQQVLDLMAGKTMRLGYGWVLVRNPDVNLPLVSEEKLTELEEKLLEHGRWKTVVRDQFGFGALREHIREAIVRHARRDIPKEARRLKTEPLSLGEGRASRQKQANFLLNIVIKFQEIRADAVSANYSKNDIFDRIGDTRLATRDMIRFGHTFAFQAQDPDSGESHQFGDYHPGHASQTTTRKYETKLEVHTVLTDSETLDWPINDQIYPWFEEQYQTSGGLGLSPFSPSLLPQVMKKQSQKWERIALGYISDIILLVNQFILDVLTDLCPDKRVSLGLLSAITMVFTKAPLFSLKNNSSKQQAVHQVHEILRLFYEVARAGFIDNVYMQCVNRLLLDGLFSPMALVSASLIHSLADQRVDEIAGEDPAVERRRRLLAAEIKEPEEARKVLL